MHRDSNIQTACAADDVCTDDHLITIPFPALFTESFLLIEYL